MITTFLPGSEQAQAATVQQALAAFVLRCRGKNLSPETVLWYQKRLGKFAGWLDRVGVDGIRQVTPNLIRAHLDSIKADGGASGTVFRTHGALRAFFRFLAGERLIPSNPMSLVEKPKRERRLIQSLTVEQIQALLAVPDTTTFYGARIWTAVLVLLDSGLRASELLGLRRDRVTFSATGAILRVIGKGDKEREVPIGSQAKAALLAFMGRYSPADSELVFTDQFGQQQKLRWLEWQVRDLAKRAGITGVKVTPHIFRHTFAVRYLSAGGNIRSLQLTLGHSDPTMTLHYLESLTGKDMAAQHRKFSPVDTLGAVPGIRRQVRLK